MLGLKFQMNPKNLFNKYDIGGIKQTKRKSIILYDSSSQNGICTKLEKIIYVYNSGLAGEISRDGRIR